MISFSSDIPVWISGGLAALAVLLVLLAGAPRRWRGWGTRPAARAAVAMLSLLALALLALAAAGPNWQSPRKQGRSHLAIVLDQSNSILRGQGGWAELVSTTAGWTERLVASIPQEELELIDAGITGVRGAATRHWSGALAELPAALRRLPTPDLGAPSTNLAAGLEQAAEILGRDASSGAVLLVSDGFQTEGDAVGAALRLATLGIAVHVRPRAGGGPAATIAAADLAERIEAGEETTARLLLATGEVGFDGQLRVVRNRGLAQDAGRLPAQHEALAVPVRLDPGQRAVVPLPFTFRGAGIQLVDFELLRDGQETLRRRVFVQVTATPRILAIGGAEWRQAIPESSALVQQWQMGTALDAATLANYDAVVINDVAATQLQRGDPATLATAVTENGLGLMLMNGAHTGRDPKGPSVLASYRGTPIDELLPVSSEPRSKSDEAPPVQLVLLIDTSGSMGDGFGGGNRLSKAKEIAAYLVANTLRPVDTLHLISFTSGAEHVVKGRSMDDAGKRAALDHLASLYADGLTKLDAALALVNNIDFDNCAVVILTDDGLDIPVGNRPECANYAFSIGNNSGGLSPLRNIAEVYIVDPSFSAGSIKLSIFDPKPRDHFFEEGSYTALAPRRGTLLLPMPALSLEGSAISYLRPGAELHAVRPRLTDPVLAYTSAGQGYTGYLATAIPAAWNRDAEGSAAVRAWIERLLPLASQDRYLFQVRDDGTALYVHIEITAEEGPLPRVDSLQGRVQMADGTEVGLTLERVPGVRSAFEGRITLPRREEVATSAFLVLTESGPDALRRSQRVALLVPPAGAISATFADEDNSTGTNESLLRAVVEAGSGVYEPEPAHALLTPLASQSEPTPLWPWLAVAAMVCFTAAVTVERLIR